MSYKKLELTSEGKNSLRSRLLRTPEVIPLASDPKFFSLLVSLGIHQEIGTIHDELSTFLFDGDTGRKIPRETLRSELIEYRDYTGVRIWAEGFTKLDPRVRGIRTLLHPDFSYDDSGSIYQCVFFPEVIAKIANLEDVELVSVRPWGINTVFGGFDPSKSYYEGNMFEFVNIDAIRYSQLLERKQIVFWGTHDLVSHVAGIRKSAWPELERRGRAARILFENYFRGVPNPRPFSLLLPYAMGMLLDDLAQPMNYNSESRRYVVEILAEAIQSKATDPRLNAFLLKFPTGFEKIITLARADDLKETQKTACKVLSSFIREIHDQSVFKIAS